MTRSSHIDAALALCAALAWAFAAFALGSRLFSETAGALAATGLLISGLAFVLSIHLSDRRLAVLVNGLCPRCGAAVDLEHSHSRWEPDQRRWLLPQTTWQCASCSYLHAEAWRCPNCPLD